MIGLIFDLDGTLVDTYDLDEKFYCRALLSEVPGVKLRDSWDDYKHSTDSGILVEILKELDLPVSEYHDSVRRHFGELLRNHFGSGNICKTVPGAPELLSRLVEIQNLRIGIATGGWNHTARMKLESAGLSDFNLPMSSSDDSPSRTEIMKICASKMENSISRFVYVGDAEWDMKSAKKLGWQFIGVGKRLKDKCDTWVSDLLDEDPFLKIL